MKNGYVQTNKDLFRKPVVDIRFSGTTCISVVIRGDLLLCANAGDSRAILGRKTSRTVWDIVELSEDHKPGVLQERKMIEKAGGVVEPYKDSTGEYIGPQRIWVPNSQPAVPGLAMTRSIGDRLASTIGVIPDPEIKSIRLTHEDKFLVIASDGIWEWLSNTVVVETVAQYWRQGQAEEAADYLVSLAVDKWLEEDEVVDDITLIIVFLN